VLVLYYLGGIKIYKQVGVYSVPFPQTLHYKCTAKIFNILFFCFIFLPYLCINVPYNDKGIKGWQLILLGVCTPPCFNKKK